MSAICPPPGLPQVCHKSANELVRDPGLQVRFGPGLCLSAVRHLFSEKFKAREMPTYLALQVFKLFSRPGFI
jgi:hypothetical protein